MIILLLFHEKSTWKFEEIHDKTQIPNESLIQVLRSLMKGKIIISNEIFEESDIKTNHPMVLNENFLK